MLFGNKDFHFLATILVLAIATSLAFHIFFKQDTTASFSELYFPFPDGLPNYIDKGKPYNFSFTVRNLEGKPLTYSYDAKLELFNLYDVSEGLFKCAERQRKKVSFKWVEGNISENRLYSLNEKPENASFAYSEIDDYGTIDWPNYNVEYIYKNVFSQGSFTTSFYFGNETKYSFTVLEDPSEVHLSYLAGKTIIQKKKKVQLNPENKVKINASGTLKYYLNGILIFDETIPNMTNGRLGFRSDDTYVLIGQLTAYKDSPLEVTQSRYIRDFDIDNRLVLDKLRSLEVESKEDTYLIRKTVNFSSACNIGSCSELKSFLNSPENKVSLNLGDNIDDPTYLLTLLDIQSRLFPDNSIAQNLSNAPIYWPNYTFRMNFQTFVKPHSFLISFDNNFMILFHNSNIFFINNLYGDAKIDRRASPVEIGVNELSLNTKEDNIVVYVNRFPMYNIKKELSFGDISIHSLNTFAIFDDISLSNKNKGCSLTPNSKDCVRRYRLPAERQIASVRQAPVVAQAIAVPFVLGITPFLGAQDITNFTSLNGGEGANQTGLDSSQLIQQLEYEIEVDPSLINSNIPSEKYTFNGRNARLSNEYNYSFAFNFAILEGSGLIGASFHDNHDTELMKLILYREKNQAYLFRNSGGSILKDEFYANLSEQSMHKLEIIFDSNTTKYKLDKEQVFEFNGVDMSNGYFSISTYNTYADVTGIEFIDKTIGRTTQFTVNTDPCRLRKIDETQIDKGSLFLDNNENSSISKKFTVNKDFDYGLVSVNLHQASQNATEIHFWLVNND